MEHSPRRLALIEYLRGAAALSVAWFHLTNGSSAEWVRLSGWLGWLGVEVFFVISGFVIPLSIASSYGRYSISDFPQFMARRILRLEPPYLFSIALVLVLWQMSSFAPGFQGSPPSWDSGQILSHLFYLVPLTEYGWLQPVYWSLAWEFVFYISMGLLFPLIGRKDRRNPWYLLVATVMALAGLGVLPDRTLLFIIGIAVYRAGLEEKGASGRLLNVAVMAGAAAMIASSSALVAIVGTAAGLLIHAFRTFEFPKFLHERLMLLGGISYSLYLTHVPVGGRIVNLGRRYVSGPLAEALLSLVALATCLAFAWVFYRVIEKPSIAFAKRIMAGARHGEGPADTRDTTKTGEATSPGS